MPGAWCCSPSLSHVTLLHRFAATSRATSRVSVCLSRARSVLLRMLVCGPDHNMGGAWRQRMMRVLTTCWSVSRWSDRWLWWCWCPHHVRMAHDMTRARMYRHALRPAWVGAPPAASLLAVCTRTVCFGCVCVCVCVWMLRATLPAANACPLLHMGQPRLHDAPRRRVLRALAALLATASAYGGCLQGMRACCAHDAACSSPLHAPLPVAMTPARALTFH
jgi:hypothetical protein